MASLLIISQIVHESSHDHQVPVRLLSTIFKFCVIIPFLRVCCKHKKLIKLEEIAGLEGQVEKEPEGEEIVGPG